MIIDKIVSFKTYREKIINKSINYGYKCPKCGARHSLVRHGFYSRNICYLDGIRIVEEKFIVQRLIEIGTDMNQFPSDAHLVSWAGMCPSNNESAGKKKVARHVKVILR